MHTYPMAGVGQRITLLVLTLSYSHALQPLNAHVDWAKMAEESDATADDRPDARPDAQTRPGEADGSPPDFWTRPAPRDRVDEASGVPANVAAGGDIPETMTLSEFQMARKRARRGTGHGAARGMARHDGTVRRGAALHAHSSTHAVHMAAARHGARVCSGGRTHVCTCATQAGGRVMGGQPRIITCKRAGSHVCDRTRRAAVELFSCYCWVAGSRTDASA